MSARSFPEFLSSREPGDHFQLGRLTPLTAEDIAERAARPIPAWTQPQASHYNGICRHWPDVICPVHDAPLPGFELEGVYQPELELEP